MTGKSEEILANPVWHALTTTHARFAVRAPRARRYPGEVAPFGGTRDNSAESFRQLLSQLGAGEAIYVMGDAVPALPNLTLEERIPGLQMTLSAWDESVRTEEHDGGMVRLTHIDAPEMVALTAVAFPGFFRARTCDMGAYFGVRLNGELIAMAGERMALPGYREISAVCTHPAHTGKGYAARLVSRLVHSHAAAGLQSFLHVTIANQRAIELYNRLGFEATRDVYFNRVSASRATAVEIAET